jgi:DNA polymerase-4
MYFHVDLDAFFASAEELDHPEYRGRPIIVGAAPGRRGVVSTCSYAARGFGVHSAMPINEAYRLCPQGVFLPVRMERYLGLSRQVFDTFNNFTPDVYGVSIDEAFLDMRGTEALFGPAPEAAKKLKAAVRERTGLTISVGVAENKLLAKLASAKSKPDGLLVVELGTETAFMDSLPLTKLWGAGEATQARLRALNVRSVRELRECTLDFLQASLGQASGLFLYQASRGIDPGIHSEDTPTRSRSTERTFEYDVSNAESLCSVLLEMSEELMFSLFKEELYARTVCVKIRYGDFSTVSARVTLDHTVASIKELYAVGERLFREKRLAEAPVRLLGLGLSGLRADKVEQGELFPQGDGRAERLERAVFGLKKSGRAELKIARTLKPPQGENDDD